MKNNYLHNDLDNKKNIILSLVLLIPLICYGVYKNGYLVYASNHMAIWEIFRPLYFLGVAFILNFIVELIFNRKIKLEYSYVNASIFSLFIMPKSSLII